MHHIVLWKWSQPGFREVYTADHVNRLAASLAANLTKTQHRIVCITDNPEGVECETIPLWEDHQKLKNPNGAHLPSCYRRLKLFDPATQGQMQIRPNDRIVSLDLDALVTGPMDEILGRKDRFVGWAVRGHYHPRVFNGSFWMFRAFDLTELWSEFHPVESPKKALGLGFFGSDQAWMSYKLARQPYTFGWAWPHMVSFPREVRVQRVLDRRTRIIFFHGAHKPWHLAVQKECPWVHRYWKMDLNQELTNAS